MSKELNKMYQKAHLQKSYGSTSVKNLRLLLPNIHILKPTSVIDFGCGKGNLLDEISKDFKFNDTFKYDPAIDEFKTKPTKKYDLLINIDVLEHVPENELHDLLSEMSQVSNDAIIIIDTAPAELILADGTNAHCTLHTREWWDAKLSEYFGPLYRFPTLRSTRVGFKTWQIKNPLDIFIYTFLRTKYTFDHYIKKIF